MREVRLYWLQTDDICITRNAHLLQRRTEDWGREANEGFIKLARLLELDIEERTPDADIPNAQSMFCDSDDEKV